MLVLHLVTISLAGAEEGAQSEEELGLADQLAGGRWMTCCLSCQRSITLTQSYFHAATAYVLCL